MKPSENIFDLIKALSGEEIEYVLKASEQHKKSDKNKYVQLFHEILSQQIYNEKELIKKLGYENNLNNFAFTKNYLYSFILSRLEEISRLPQVVLRQKINQAELFANPKIQPYLTGLMAEVQHETSVFQLFDSQLSLIEIKNSIQKDQDGQKAKKLLKAKKSLLHYQKLFAFVRLKHHQSSFISDILKTPEFKNVYEEELLEPDENYNFHHKVYFYLAKSIVYYATKDYINSLKMCEELNKLWSKHPEMIHARFVSYYHTYYNKALVECNTGQFSESIKTINYLQKKLDDFNRGTLFQKYMLYNLLIDIYNSCGYFEKSLEVVSEYTHFRESLNNTEVILFSEQQYHFYLAKVYYGTNDLKSASKHLNQIINNDLEYTGDITCMAYILSLIIYFETNKIDMLEYSLNHVQKQLQKRNSLLGSFQLLINFFKTYIKKQPGAAELQKMYEQLKLGIETNVKTDAAQENLLTYFNLAAWVASKIEKCSMAEMLKKQTNRSVDILS